MTEHEAPPEAVEAGARAIHDAQGFYTPWEHRSEWFKEKYREEARTIVPAFLAAGWLPPNAFQSGRPALEVLIDTGWLPPEALGSVRATLEDAERNEATDAEWARQGRAALWLMRKVADSCCGCSCHVCERGHDTGIQPHTERCSVRFWEEQRAAGWRPPEEAEKETKRADAAWNLWQKELRKRRELESSWVSPERVETIDCPLTDNHPSDHDKALYYAYRDDASFGDEEDQCEFCGGSGKLQIVRAE